MYVYSYTGTGGHGILLAGATPPRGHRDFELYIVTLSPINLDQLLRRQRRPLLIRVVDARRRREDGGSRI